MNVAISRYARRERGASLLTALIFMVIMAMLSVTLANVTNLEERMASNTRDRDLALQAAEAALRDAEVQLGTPAFRASVVNMFDATLANSAAYWETCFHTRMAPCDHILEPEKQLPTLGAGAVNAQPGYIVEQKPDLGTTKIYRVTARAVGGDKDTIVVLQTELGVTP